MLRRFRSQHIEMFTLPVGWYRTALDVIEGLFQCTNKAPTPWHLNIAIDNEWNITITSQDVWIMVTAPVAQALGWINSENKPRWTMTLDIRGVCYPSVTLSLFRVPMKYLRQSLFVAVNTG